MLFRTDLALERRELLGKESIEGVKSRSYESFGTTVSEIRITSEDGARLLGKPVGTYITVEVPTFTRSAELTDGRLDAVAQIIRSLLPPQGTVLVAGLGNPAITADALGPRCAQQIFATRHIGAELQKTAGLSALRPVAVLQPGVLGCTGIEAAEIIAAVAEKIKPCAIISVDALAAKSVKRLAGTIQISDTGISPGSGVGNHRKEISKATAGVPVIAIGVPTVVDALSLAKDVTGCEEDKAGTEYADMLVAPREADTVTESAAMLLALAINCALQPQLTAEELLSLSR